MSEADDDDGTDDDSEWKESCYFVGECTCSHDEQDHSFGGCGVDDCPCEAGWEE